MTVLIVRYEPTSGLTLPDSKIEAFVSDQIMHALTLKNLKVSSNLQHEIIIGSELILIAFRAAIAAGCISTSDVEFWHEDYKLEIGVTGCYINWPDGVVSYFDKFVRKITLARRR